MTERKSTRSNQVASSKLHGLNNQTYQGCCSSQWKLSKHNWDGQAPEDEGKANAMLHILVKQHMNMMNDKTHTHITQPHGKALKLSPPSTPTTDTTSMLHQSKTTAYLCLFFSKKEKSCAHTQILLLILFHLFAMSVAADG